MKLRNELLTEIRRAFECGEIDYTRIGGDGTPSRDGVIAIGVLDMDIRNYGPARIVESLKAMLPTGAKFAYEILPYDRLSTAFLFAHPELERKIVTGWEELKREPLRVVAAH
jgi:hypothetical protein